jgi:hypothetical protein
MNTASNTVPPSLFQTKYDEFAKELLATFPEQAVAIHAAISLSPSARLEQFQAHVRTADTSSNDINPGTLLPGVILTDSVWATLSTPNRGVIWDYIRLLSMTCFLEGFGTGGSEGSAAPPWMEGVMGDLKTKLGSLDFEGLFKKFTGIFGDSSSAGADASGSSSPFSFPKLPEKFLKGQLAKLAEEIVKDIKPEDLGLSPEMMAACETSPSRAFELLIQVFTKNPGIIQATIKKIGNRLQQKVQSGAIRPQDIVKEAEELMKEFAGNTEFVGMMDTFKTAFGFDDMDLGKQSGSDGSARLSLVKERLRKKLEAKKAAASGLSSVASNSSAASNSSSSNSSSNSSSSSSSSSGNKNKQNKKK